MIAYSDSTINRIEMEKRDLCKRLMDRNWNFCTSSHERVFVGFLDAVDTLIEMDASDYADRCNYHYEWMAERYWDVMHPLYKEQIVSAIPNIADFMFWGGVSQDNHWVFRSFYNNVVSRIVLDEKAEIIKRAQTKMLKEEIAMAVMHPDRIERFIEKHGIDAMECF